jgi:prefoldin subunit 5
MQEHQQQQQQQQHWIPSEHQLRVNDIVYQCETNRTERARAQQRASLVADTRRTVAALLATPTRSALVPMGGGKAFVRATAQLDSSTGVLASIGDDYFLPCTSTRQLDELLNRRSDAIQRAVDDLDNRFAQLHAQLEQIQAEAALDDDPAALLDIAEPLLDDISESSAAAMSTIDIDDNDNASNNNLSGPSSHEQMARDFALIASVFDRFNGLEDADDAVVPAPAPPSERYHVPLQERAAPRQTPQQVSETPVSDVVVERRAHSTAPETTAVQSTQPARVSLFKQRRQQQQQQNQ